ncbi:MAG: hypothetical protein WKG01_32460 [Kofleriaceae bacterium]
MKYTHESEALFVQRTATPARATITLHGHKHSAVPILAASLAAEGVVELERVPHLQDTLLMLEIMRAGGARATLRDERATIDPDGFSRPDVPPELSRPIHGSLYCVPAVLGRVGAVEFATSGGCAIGPSRIAGQRPSHHVVDVLRRLGASVETSDGGIRAKLRRFTGGAIDVDAYSSGSGVRVGPLLSGATKTALIAAAFTRNATTTIERPYRKLDVCELARFVGALGHEVTVGDDAIVVAPGCARVHTTTFDIPPDLSELMTLVAGSVHLQVPLRVLAWRLSELRHALGSELDALAAMGVSLRWDDDGVDIDPPSSVAAIDIDVTPDGIYSDHQPFFALMLLRARGRSRIRDRVWTERFAYADELARMGARVERNGNVLTLMPSRLHATQTLSSSDLRSAAVLALAAAGSGAVTRIDGAGHLQRGYVDFTKLLEALGARAWRSSAPIGLVA